MAPDSTDLMSIAHPPRDRPGRSWARSPARRSLRPEGLPSRGSPPLWHVEHESKYFDTFAKLVLAWLGARNPVALRHLYAVKGRPVDHPVIVHLPVRPDIDLLLAPWAAALVGAGVVSVLVFPAIAAAVHRRGKAAPGSADLATFDQEHVDERGVDPSVDDPGADNHSADNHGAELLLSAQPTAAASPL